LKGRLPFSKARLFIAAFLKAITLHAVWVAAGASFIGGCCDTNPAYIAALARRWRGNS